MQGLSSPFTSCCDSDDEDETLIKPRSQSFRVCPKAAGDRIGCRCVQVFRGGSAEVEERGSPPLMLSTIVIS